MNKIKLLTFFFLSMLFFASCGDDLEDINIDPNNPTQVPAATLVTQAQQSLFSRLAGRNLNAEWGMLMVQQWAQNEYCEESRYEVDGTSFNASFNAFYVSVLEELRVARSITSEDGTLTDAVKKNRVAVIDVLTAIAFQSLTDGFGDIPYSQALNSDFPNPSYDMQKDIYPQILANLKSAVDNMNGSEAGFDTGDVLLKGDMSQWKKLTNSLILRAAMRIADKDESTARQYVTDAASDLISSNAENVLYRFDPNPIVANPLWIDVNINNRDDFCVSELFVEWLKNAGDPRLSAYAEPTSTGEYVGMPYGLDDNTATTLKGSTSRPNPQVRAADAPYILMDYANVQFFLAEAYERGFLTGNAEEAYMDGVTASMNYWGFTDVDSYLDDNSYDASNWKKSIGEQKWVALYTNGYEAWAEWRRLGYPMLEPGPAAVIDEVPVRLPYPIDEQTNNSSQLNKVTTNPNSLTQPVWWDE